MVLVIPTASKGQVSKFISRKDLEIRHANSYEMRGRLKELGCEWDGIAGAWIAPSVEVKELCYEMLEKYEGNQYLRPYFGRQTIDWDDMTYESVFGSDDDVPEVTNAKSVCHTPTVEEIKNIVGEENFKRYCKEETIAEVATVLASGENNNQKIHERLESQGWKSRQVLLILDVVEHFRTYPPLFLADETEDSVTLPTAKDAVDPDEMDGSITLISDKEGNPVKLAIAFPYNPIKVNRIKWYPGRQWNAQKKRWEVPIDSCHGSQSILEEFPYFSCSPKVQELKEKLLKK